jgi:chromosome segregation ATPase
MGLFKKRSTDPGELDRLRSEIASMAARLDAADADKAQLHSHLESISTRLDTPSEPPPPPPPALDPVEIDTLRSRIERLQDRVERSPEPVPIDPATIRALDARIDRLNAELAASLADTDEPESVDRTEFDALRDRIEQLDARLAATPTPPPPPPATPTVDPSELDELRDRVAQLDARLASLDARITSISTELANQLTELSGEVDALGARTADEPIVPTQAIDVDEVVDELRDAQTRLANEQARYQIAFRRDLAELAERLRRS